MVLEMLVCEDLLSGVQTPCCPVWLARSPFHPSCTPVLHRCPSQGRAGRELHELGSSTCTAFPYLLLELAGSRGPINIFKFSTLGKSLLFVSLSDAV